VDEEVKERLVARFRAYLDSAEAAAATAGTEGSEAAPDLFTLLAEVAAVKNDVKLQSRQFKTALEELRALVEGLRGTAGRAEDAKPEVAKAGQAEHTGPQGLDKAEKALTLELLDLRDRIQAGHDQAARYRPGRGLTGGGAAPARFVAAMAEGMAMNLKRLDATLARRGIRPLAAVGEAFDPHTMHAVEQARDPYRAEGTVVAELRKGFLHCGTLLRPAEVVVNRIEGKAPEGRDQAYRDRIFWSQWSQV